tara:strand:+ start:1804 stop:2892 length:1089 start_codon:yes stop_codon:yes gene_type:complete
MLNSFARVAGLEKTARIWSRPAVAVPKNDFAEAWSERFKGSPFHKKAQILEYNRSGDRVEDAEREIRWSERSLEDAKFRVKIAQIEKKLADWSFSQEGSEKTAFQEKLAECRYRSFQEWSDYFKGSPFYKVAMALEVEEAQREAGRRRADLDDRGNHQHYLENSADRAELEAEFAAWRLEQMGFSKTASVVLATMSSEDPTMPLPEETVAAFFAEVDNIEKIARAPMSRGTAAGIAATLGIAGGAVGGGTVGHKKGRKKGQREGLRAGYMHGARRGFHAGRRYTIAQLKARMAQVRGGKTKKASFLGSVGRKYIASPAFQARKKGMQQAAMSAGFRKGLKTPKAKKLTFGKGTAGLIAPKPW